MNDLSQVDRRLSHDLSRLQSLVASIHETVPMLWRMLSIALLPAAE